MTSVLLWKLKILWKITVCYTYCLKQVWMAQVKGSGARYRQCVHMIDTYPFSKGDLFHWNKNIWVSYLEDISQHMRLQVKHWIVPWSDNMEKLGSKKKKDKWSERRAPWFSWKSLLHLPPCMQPHFGVQQRWNSRYQWKVATERNKLRNVVLRESAAVALEFKRLFWTVWCMGNFWFWGHFWPAACSKS